MALTPEEKAQLDALTEKANTPDEDEFDIEIWDSSGQGAKVPYRKGRGWLQKTFGIDLPEAPEAGTDTEDTGAKRPGAKRPGPGAATPDNVTHATKYFGSKNQAS